VVSGFSAALGCLLTPLLVVGAILGLAAWFVAAKEALDLSWGQTIVTVIIGWVVYFIVGLVFGAILGLLGIGVSGLTGVLGA
jgi:cbb3-type cytochrome oxidase subunit 1